MFDHVSRKYATERGVRQGGVSHAQLLLPERFMPMPSTARRRGERQWKTRGLSGRPCSLHTPRLAEETDIQ